MNVRAKGSRNQRKSRDYILSQPKYKVDSSQLIEIVRSGIGSLDFFSDKIDKAGWDLICLGDDFVYVIQTKTNKKPTKKYIELLKNMQLPKYVKRELHVWYDYVKKPEVICLD